MNILFLSAWWPSRVHPTHGNFVEKHARLVARRHQVTVVAIQEDPEIADKDQEVYETVRDGFREVIVYFGRGEQQSQFSLLRARFRAYQRGIRLAARLDGRPQLIHANILLDAGVVAALYSVSHRIPFVVSEHASRYTRKVRLSILRRTVARWAARRAYRVMPVSKFLANSMRDFHGLHGKYDTVGNVVDASLFRQSRHTVRNPDGPIRLLHVSNFDEYTKNISGLLAAFKQACAEQPGYFTLRIAGDGDPEILRSKIQVCGLSESQVTVSGPHTEVEVAELMRLHDVFILFSNMETQGVALLEAQCCGLPSVVTNVGAIPEAMSEGFTGYLVDPKDRSALAQAIKRLGREYVQFDPNAIRIWATDRCAEPVILEKLTSIYEAAVSPKSLRSDDQRSQ